MSPSNKRNASDSAFGWDFQVNSAIFLFLKNLDTSESIEVEGQKEDVEINLSDNTKIYAQVKAVVDPEDTRNLQSKLTKAIKTLYEAFDGNCKLIYVTNAKNPLMAQRSSFDKVTYLRFGELNNEEQTFIKKSVEHNKINNFSYDNFYILDIPFYGDDLENRYKYIREKVNDFFSDMNISGQDYSKRIFEIWQNTLFKNATQQRVLITKKQFLWPLVVLFCEKIDVSWLFEKYEESIVRDVLSIYDSTITYNSENFKLVTKVLNLFEKFSSTQLGNKRFLDYIEKHFKDYRDDITIYTDNEDYRDIVIQVILYKILCKRMDIGKLKGVKS